ncbi:MAG: DUF4340 domain-containing protein [Planctomycetes bacterium]|nr:DUF4340 domain-containing protein [Planctomycetota bacterium]
MNLRITALFFGLLLSMLWVFGLMIAHRKIAGDPGYIMSTLHGKDVAIDSVVIKRTDKEKGNAEFEFVSIGDKWFLKEDKQQVRVESFRIDQQIIKQIKDARNDATADVSRDPGLTSPRIVVTLSGKLRDKKAEWKFLVGRDSADKSHVFVATPDRPDKVFSVAKKDIDGLFFDNPNTLRMQRLFSFIEPSVNAILVKKGAQPLELRRSGSMWTFIQPPLGPAGAESEADDKDKKDPHDFMKKKKPAPPKTGGVKGLLADIINLRVDGDDDFVPLGKAPDEFGLAAGKEMMRIEINSSEKKEVTKEVLLIGDKIKGKNDAEFYYAKLDSDDGVVKLSAQLLQPILKALTDPGDLRSRDVAVFDAKKVDAVEITQGDVKAQFFLQQAKDELKLPFAKDAPPSHWYLVQGGERKKANDAALATLLDQVAGKRGIIEFLDVTDADAAKKDNEWGLAKPAAKISLYVAGIDNQVKDDKKDAKKSEKQLPKKDAKDKKDPKKDEPLPTLKKNHPAVVTLAVGKIDKDHVYIRRTLEDGKTTSRFKMKKEFAEKVLPPEGVVVAYLDTDLPKFDADRVSAMKLHRTTDKGPQTLDLENRQVDGKSYWYINEGIDPKTKQPAGFSLADAGNASLLVTLFAQMHAKKWIKKLDEKDLDSFGLKSPGIQATISISKVSPAAKAASTIADLGVVNQSVWGALLGTVGKEKADPGETVTIALGKEAEKGKTVYARHSGSPLLFTVDADLVKFIKERDLRDKSSILNAYGLRVASLSTIASGDALSAYLLASPQVTGLIHRFKADDVKEVRLVVRTPFELRIFQFDRIAKEKPKDAGKEPAKDKESPWTWTDNSKIPEFQLEPEKVAQFVKDLAALETSRFASYAGSGPRGAQTLVGGDYKLGDKELTLKIDLAFEGGTTVTLKVGANSPPHGYFAHSSFWPETIFFLPPAMIDPITRGPSAYFGKKHVAAE